MQRVDCREKTAFSVQPSLPVGVTATAKSVGTESATVTGATGTSTVNDAGGTEVGHPAAGALYDYTSGSAPANVSDSVFFVYNPANGHWYQEVRLPNKITWPDARAAAEQLSFAGFPGHLATVTSAAERQAS